MIHKYELTEDGVLNLETGASIPAIHGNRHWEEFQIWVADGNIPAPVKPSEHHVWVHDGWVLDVDAAQSAIDVAEIAELDATMIAQADTLIDCLIRKGVLDGTEPEIADLITKSQRKKELKARS